MLQEPRDRRTGAEAAPVLRVARLSKTFPGQRALNDVTFELNEGEVHALVGENGSGKSTLIKVLAGFHRPDPGSIATLCGDPMSLDSPSRKRLAAMRFVHQDFALVPTLSVRDNFGIENVGRGLSPVKRREERQTIAKLLATFDLDLDPERLVASLTPFEKAAVTVARAIGTIDGEVKMIVLDEPTASLGVREKEDLLRMIRNLAERGIAIVYVSHFLDEVMEIADRVTVLRDGRVVTSRSADGLDKQELVQLIVGRHLEQLVKDQGPDESAGDGMLKVRGLRAPSLDGIDLDLAEGEILGITGRLGSGYDKIADCLAGSMAIEAGEIEIDGNVISRLTPRTAMAAGLVTVVSDRRGLGLIQTLTVAENIALPDSGRNFKRGYLSRRREAADAASWAARTEVWPPDPNRLVSALSGGNQQKVLLAKALRLRPKVLVLADPTQAVDVGAAQGIRRQIVGLGESGQSVLVLSSDPEELEQICDRVLITRHGRIVCELKGSEISQDKIVHESQFDG